MREEVAPFELDLRPKYQFTNESQNKWLDFPIADKKTATLADRRFECLRENCFAPSFLILIFFLIVIDGPFESGLRLRLRLGLGGY
jgi:hypothetical protein